MLTKAGVGEDDTVLISQLLLQLLHRALQAQHDNVPGAAAGVARVAERGTRR